MKSEEIINHINLNDAKRIIIFVEKEDGSQIAEWEGGHHFQVSSAGTRRNMHAFVKFMYDTLHKWMMEDIPTYNLKPEPTKPKAKKT